MKYFNKTTIGFTLTWLALTIFLICFYFYFASPLISNAYVSSEQYLYYTYSADLVNGKVPYRDIVEGKGPLWLFLFAGFNYLTPWSMLSETILIGICCMGLFFLSYKTARLFLTPYPSFLVSFFPILLLRFSSQQHPQTEFFSSLFILLSIYAVCRLFLDTPELTARQEFFWGAVSGISFAVVFWMKYQLVGLWIGLIFTLILLLILRKITVKKFFSLFLSHLTGFVIPTTGILIYFGIHGAIGNLFYIYFFARFNFGSSVDNSAIIDTASSSTETSSAVATESLFTYSQNLSMYIYIIELVILAILSLIALLAHNSYNLALKIFIFSGVICSFILAFLVILLERFLSQDFGVTETRNSTVVICFTIFTMIYWIGLITCKIQHSAFSKVPKLLGAVLNLIMLGIIYWSGNFGYAASSVQYIWDAKTTSTRLSNPSIEQLRDGPYFFEQMASWLKEHYPNSKFTTYNPELAFELHQPEILKYVFCLPNPEICQLYYQGIRDKISDGEITLLITNAGITDLNQIASPQQMHNQLDYSYGENSLYQVSSTVLDRFVPVLAINQYNSMYVLWINDSTV